MSKTIILLYLADPRYGGWVTYTSHLYHSMKLAGYQVILIKISSRDEKSSRDYGNDVQYLNMSLNSAVNLCKQYKALITASGPGHEKNTAALMEAGANIVIHDPTEMRKPLIACMKKPVITIGELNKQSLKLLGVESHVIRHPYIQRQKTSVAKDLFAMSHARIDWDKKTHLLVEANALLPEGKKIKIFGAENSLYTHHKIDPKGWEEAYAGKFPKTLHAGVDLCSRAEFCIDFSVIKNDGGRTQYTFLEAWDAETPLVLHKQWLSDKDPACLSGENVLVAESPEELKTVLLETPKTTLEKLKIGGKETLKASQPLRVVSDVLEHL